MISLECWKIKLVMSLIKYLQMNKTPALNNP